MENLWWFLGTVILYYVTDHLLYHYYNNPCRINAEWLSDKNLLKRLGIIALLCLPININDHVFTVLGNGVAEKSMWSVCSLYQKAGSHAVSGLALCQKAGGTAFSLFNFFGYQRSENENTISGVGIVSAQFAKRESVLAVGISGYQQSQTQFKQVKQKKRMGTMVGTGISCWQESQSESIVGVGFVGYQNSKNGSFVGIGGAGRQRSEKAVHVPIGIALYQQVPGASRVFGAFWPLKAVEEN
ncbi:MAG: hypothetical protein ABH822_01030 [Patescibacteria group bacterium]